jgi:hypothetical protein
MVSMPRKTKCHNASRVRSFVSARSIGSVAFLAVPLGLMSPLVAGSNLTPHQHSGRPAVFAQSSEPGSADTLKASQVDQYVAVYKAMQKNHGLSVQQACAKQGLTVAQFRDIENKIERDEQLREIVRRELKPASTPAGNDNEN